MDQSQFQFEVDTCIERASIALKADDLDAAIAALAVAVDLAELNPLVSSSASTQLLKLTVLLHAARAIAGGGVDRALDSSKLEDRIRVLLHSSVH